MITLDEMAVMRSRRTKRVTVKLILKPKDVESFWRRANKLSIGDFEFVVTDADPDEIFDIYEWPTEELAATGGSGTEANGGSKE
jgi:hypothetical protein